MNKIKTFIRIITFLSVISAVTGQAIFIFLKNNVDTALAYYERALKKDSNNPKILLYLVTANHKMGRYDIAEKKYKKLKKVDPALDGEFSYLDVKSKSTARASGADGFNGVITWEEE